MQCSSAYFGNGSGPSARTGGSSSSSRTTRGLTAISGIQTLQEPARVPLPARPFAIDPHEAGVFAARDEVVAACRAALFPPCRFHAIQPCEAAQRAAVMRDVALHFEGNGMGEQP